MTTLLVTATSGHLGRLIVEALLERGITASDIVATARRVDDIADLAARGLVTRRADYTDPSSLKEAFAGVDRAVLVSSSAVGQRVEHHRNVIVAAGEAGIELLAYTSILGADASSLALAAEHKATEQLLVDSNLPHVVLRNSWYLENYTEQLATALERGVVIGSAGDGRVSAALRADYASAAASVLTGSDHAGKVYELGGEAFTLAEYASEVTKASGHQVVYQDMPLQEYVSALVRAGVPEGFAQVLADSDRGIARGELFTTSDDLARLIGRPTTSLAQALRDTLT